MDIFVNSLAEVIASQDFIVLPQIGSFLSEYSKPYLDSNNNVVAPSKELHFNEIINIDQDHKLISLLATKLGISIDECENKYIAFCNDLKYTLNQNQSYRIDNFGVFGKNREGQIIFSPIKNYDKSESHIVQTEVQNTNQLVEKVAEEHPLVNLSEENADETFESKKDKNTNGLMKLILYLIPIGLLILGLFYIIFMNKSNPTIDNSESQMQEDLKHSSGLDSTEVWNQDTVKHVIGDTIISDTNAMVSQNVTELNTKRKDSVELLISIGSYEFKNNADKMAKKLISQGFPIKTQKNKKGYKLYMMASSEAEAKEISDKLERLIGEKPFYRKVNN